jgi:hypothetical protein
LTFEQWLKTQVGNRGGCTPTPEELAILRRLFNETIESTRSGPKIGSMKLPPIAGEQRYAVAIKDGADLWLTLWVKCSRKGEVFILYPGDARGDAHASYHLKGAFHQKIDDHRVIIQDRQPLTAAFAGSEHLGAYGGHSSTGAVCDPKAFDAVVCVEPGTFRPAGGLVVVDLVEAGYHPRPDFDFPLRQTFPRDARPSVVITIARANQIAPVLRWPGDFVRTYPGRQPGLD